MLRFTVSKPRHPRAPRRPARVVHSTLRAVASSATPFLTAMLVSRRLQTHNQLRHSPGPLRTISRAHLRHGTLGLDDSPAQFGLSTHVARRTKRLDIARQFQRAILGGLSRASVQFTVDPQDYLDRIRRAHALSIGSFRDMFFVPQETVDHLADQTISAAIKLATIEGTGLGIGGLVTVVPDLGILAVICMRMIQKLSLLYGFECATENEIAELWIAAASAAGVTLGRDLVEKEVVERFVPRVMERIALRAGAEVAEKWTARLIPVVSGAIGGALNYYFVRAWGRRAKQHFRERHLRMRGRLALPARTDSYTLHPPKS